MWNGECRFDDVQLGKQDWERRSYLRVGGKISDSFFVDYDFNTIDLCIVVQTEAINEKYKKKFLN